MKQVVHDHDIPLILDSSIQAQSVIVESSKVGDANTLVIHPATTRRQ